MKSFCYVLFLVNVGSVLLMHSTTRLRTQWAQLNRSILKDIEIEAPVAEAAHAGLWDHFDNTVSLSPSLARKIHGFANAAHVVFDTSAIAASTNFCLALRSPVGLSTPLHEVEVYSLRRYAGFRSPFLQALTVRSTRSERSYVHMLKALVHKSDHSLRLRYEYKGEEPRWILLQYAELIAADGQTDSLEFILVQSGVKRHQLIPSLRQIRMLPSVCPEQPVETRHPRTQILDAKYPALVRILSRVSSLDHHMMSGLSSNGVKFRVTNPTFHNGDILYRYTDAHQCDLPNFIEGPGTSYILRSTRGRIDLANQLNLNPDESDKGCYKGLEDPRTFNATHFLASTQLGKQCLTTQVLVTNGSVTPLASIQIGKSEKNWVHFDRSIIVYKLFDTTQTTTLIKCEVKCYVHKQIAWKTVSGLPNLSGIRSGSNWLPMKGRQNVKFSIAHSAYKDGEDDWIYRSHYIWWDIESNKMNVSGPIWHTTPHMPKAKKGFVEFATSIRYVSESWIQVAFGSSDCFAVIASVNIIKLTHKLEARGYFSGHLTGSQVKSNIAQVQEASMDIQVLTPSEFQRYI